MPTITPQDRARAAEVVEAWSDRISQVSEMTLTKLDDLVAAAIATERERVASVPDLTLARAFYPNYRKPGERVMSVMEYLVNNEYSVQEAREILNTLSEGAKS